MRWYTFSKHGVWILVSVVVVRNWLLSSAYVNSNGIAFKNISIWLTVKIPWSTT